MSVFSLKIVLSRRVPRTLILLLVLMLAVSMSAGVSTVQADANYYYHDNGDGTCTIYFYAGTEDAVDIPSTLGGLTVTAISDGAFLYCSIKSVTIPGGVTSIGDRTFASCNALTSVTIPDGVTSIGSGAFSECSSLTSVTIPDSVTSIGGGAFSECSSLTSVTIPDSVTSIGNNVFESCIQLTSVTIPSGVTSIGERTFASCSALTSVTIPSIVTSIGYSAFSGCSKLTSVTIPDSVTSIGDSAFSGCSKLTSVTIPDSVTSIGYGVFESCVKLASVTIPSNVTSIGHYAFAWCSGLTSITIPNSITFIGHSAFDGCSALTNIYFDGSMPTLAGSNGFGGAPSFRTYYCPIGNTGGITLSPLTQVATKTVTISAVACNYITPSTYSGMPGETISLKVAPPSGYMLQHGSLKYNDGSDHPISGTSFIMPDSNITISAVFKANGGDGGSEPSSGGGRTSPAAPIYHAGVNTGSGSDARLAVTVDKNSGTASVDLSAEAGLLSDGKETVITVPPIPDVGTYTLGIPISGLSTADRKSMLTFKTGTGTVTVPSNMLTGITGISGRKVGISIGQGDKNRLTKDVKDVIGSRPLIQISLFVDGKQLDWNNPDAPAVVSIPYSPTAEELANQESIVIWYIDGSGNAVSVPNGRYDAVTGTVGFTTTHFSDYAVVYNKMIFNDVAKSAWYYKAVSFIAARDITTGTGNRNFSPKAKLTRGEFMVMLMKAYGIAPDSNSTDNFSDAGSTYYTGYLAAAKRLGITAGVGNNMFAPDKKITRQEMFTLLYNSLKVIGQLPQSEKPSQDSADRTRSDFTDAGRISFWAKDAMTVMIETGTVSGNGGKLSPISTTTRAEMAQVLYNLLTQ